MSFQGLKGGDRIRFRVRNGLKVVNGRGVQEYAERVAKVHVGRA